MNKNRLMTHMIPYFPNRQDSMAAALGMADGGASFLEVQFPFSDPTAGGPVIEQACMTALANGFTVSEGFRFVRELVDQVSIPVFIMTYASLVVRAGVEKFVEEAKSSGAKGLIVPDLPPDYDEGLYRTGKKHDIAIIPVITPFISEKRLAQIIDLEPEYIYPALRKGITGDRTEIGEQNTAILKRLSSKGFKTLPGFGIQSHQQVTEICEYAHAAVVGSYLVRELFKNSPVGVRERIAAEVKKLLVGNNS